MRLFTLTTNLSETNDELVMPSVTLLRFHVSGATSDSSMGLELLLVFDLCLRGSF
jgi:hypothetical protein